MSAAAAHVSDAEVIVWSVRRPTAMDTSCFGCQKRRLYIGAPVAVISLVLYHLFWSSFLELLAPLTKELNCNNHLGNDAKPSDCV